MQVIIDLDSHSAIQSFTNRSPAGVYQFKSQDTVEWELYFVQGGLVQDLGAGFAVKFGMIKSDDTTNTLLAYQTVFNYLTDVNGNTYYSGLVNFNTSQMATAIGTLPSFQGTAEIRYQDTLNEIIHTINISTIVYKTILVETGVTPPGVSAGYPDASTIELLVHKNAASGYAGLTSGAKLIGSTIPVDNQTVKIDSNGNIASARILAKTTANFTTPAVNANVTITVDSTTSIKPSSYVYIPTAGYYIVLTISDTTHCIISNNGDPFNAVSGTTISSGTVVLPAQAAAGGGGGSGQPAYTSLSTGFTVPAVGATVAIVVGNTTWMGGNGYGIFITGAGYYLVNSITDVNNLTVINTGSGSNSVPGSTVSSGGTVSAAGPMGPAGASGSALSGYDSLAAAITMPAANATVNIQISNTAWLGVGQVIYIAGGGYFSVANVISTTNVNVTNLNYIGNVGAGTSIPSGSKVSPGGLQGPQGAGGAGLNAFTTLSSGFTQPAINSNVTITVGTTAWMVAGQGVYIAAGGYYNVVSITDLTHAVVVNLGVTGNTASGIAVSSGGAVSPAGTPGTNGVNAYTVTTVNFTTPTVGTSVNITVQSSSWASVGQNVYITGAGYYQVVAIISPTQLSVSNLSNYGNTASGTNVASGAAVTPAGVLGPAGAAGPQGAAGRDGAYATIYTDKSITGNGGVSTPAVLVGDIAQGTGAYQIYQRNSAGNSVWGAIPVDGSTVTITGSGQLKSIDPLDAIGAHIETPSVKSYTLDLSAPVAYTITGLVAVTSAGTCTVNLQRNGSTISGGSALSITSTPSTTTLSQAVTAGDKITLQVTATSSGTDLQISMRIQK